MEGGLQEVKLGTREWIEYIQLLYLLLKQQ